MTGRRPVALYQRLFWVSMDLNPTFKPFPLFRLDDQQTNYRYFQVLPNGQHYKLRLVTFTVREIHLTVAVGGMAVQRVQLDIYQLTDNFVAPICTDNMLIYRYRCFCQMGNITISRKQNKSWLISSSLPMITLQMTQNFLHRQIYMSKGEKTAIGYGLRHGYMGVPDCILLAKKGR